MSIVTVPYVGQLSGGVRSLRTRSPRRFRPHDSSSRAGGRFRERKFHFRLPQHAREATSIAPWAAAHSTAPGRITKLA
jgi:hypothetical protein